MCWHDTAVTLLLSNKPQLCPLHQGLDQSPGLEGLLLWLLYLSPRDNDYFLYLLCLYSLTFSSFLTSLALVFQIRIVNNSSFCKHYGHIIDK